MQIEFHDAFKSGFVAIIGRPNVGKSTLLNRLVGEKIAIVTHKPQTTRSRILGILNGEKFQIVFIDTPGIHKPVHRLGETLVNKAYSSIKDNESNIFIIDATDGITDVDIKIIKNISRKSDAPLILVVNKIDLKPKIDLDKIREKVQTVANISAIVPISALKGTNLNILLGIIVENLPQGPKYYDNDFITDMNEAQMISEIIREKLILALHQEIPYQSAVIVEKFEPKNDNPKVLHIRANIIVARSGQKAIVIGHNGKMIKKIGTLARIELEKIFHRKIFLELWVKIHPDWFKKDKFIKEYL